MICDVISVSTVYDISNKINKFLFYSKGDKPLPLVFQYSPSPNAITTLITHHINDIRNRFSSAPYNFYPAFFIIFFFFQVLHLRI